MVARSLATQRGGQSITALLPLCFAFALAHTAFIHHETCSRSMIYLLVESCNRVSILRDVDSSRKSGRFAADIYGFQLAPLRGTSGMTEEGKGVFGLLSRQRRQRKCFKAHKEARHKGMVHIKRRDEQEFIITPARSTESALDVDRVQLDLTAAQIVRAVREVRERNG